MRWATKRKLPRWLTIVLIVLGAALLVGAVKLGMFFWALSRIDANYFTRTVPEQYQVLDEKTGKPSQYALNITNAQAIGLEAVDDWLSKRTEGEGFQWLMYTDPDSWDAFIYIPEIQRRGGDLTNTDATMEITERDLGRSLDVYLRTENVKTNKKLPREQIFHFSAPMLGAWPTQVRIYVDGAELSCDNIQVYN